MIKYALLRDYDEGEFQQLVLDFHKGEYMTSQMESYGLHKLYPEIYEEYVDLAEEAAHTIIPEFIREIQEWIEFHDEENPDVFFEKRYEEEFLQTGFYGIPTADVLGTQESNMFGINLDQIAYYMGGEQKFLEWFYHQQYYATPEQVWEEDIESRRDDFEYENPEMSEEEIEQLVEEARENPDYEALFEYVKDEFDMYKSPKETFGYRPSRPQEPTGVFEAETFFNDPDIKEAIKRWWEQTGMTETVDRWELARSTPPDPDDLWGENRWIQDTTNLEQVQKAKVGLERLQRAQSGTLKEKAVAITLALNLQHNSGQLLDDHLDMDTSFLDQLDQLDVSEWEQQIEQMLAETGKSKSELYEEEKARKENEKYLRTRLDDMWQWKADRERFGRRNWYKRVKSAKRVGRLNLGALRAFRTSS